MTTDCRSNRFVDLWLASILLVCFAAGAHAQSGARSFLSNGVEIHYTDRGAGEPVVLIHAMLETLNAWEGTGVATALLDAGFRVIAFDVRGFGASDKPTTAEQYGIEVVHDVVRLLDHVNIDRAHVVGHSMGGHIANGVRAVHPDRLLTVTLGGIGWSAGSGTNMGLGQRLANALSSYDGTNLDEVIRAGTPPSQPVPTDEQVAAIGQGIRATSDPAALAALFRNGSFVRHTAQSLATNSVPTLLLVGDRDPVITEAEGLAVAMLNSRLVQIPGATHGGARRDPVFRNSLLSFLRSRGNE